MTKLFSRAISLLLVPALLFVEVPADGFHQFLRQPANHSVFQTVFSGQAIPPRRVSFIRPLSLRPLALLLVALGIGTVPRIAGAQESPPIVSLKKAGQPETAARDLYRLPSDGTFILKRTWQVKTTGWVLSRLELYDLKGKKIWSLKARNMHPVERGNDTLRHGHSAVRKDRLSSKEMVPFFDELLTMELTGQGDARMLHPVPLVLPQIVYWFGRSHEKISRLVSDRLAGSKAVLKTLGGVGFGIGLTAYVHPLQASVQGPVELPVFRNLLMLGLTLLVGWFSRRQLEVWEERLSQNSWQLMNRVVMAWIDRDVQEKVLSEGKAIRLRTLMQSDRQEVKGLLDVLAMHGGLEVYLRPFTALLGPFIVLLAGLSTGYWFLIVYGLALSAVRPFWTMYRAAKNQLRDRVKLVVISAIPYVGLFAAILQLLQEEPELGEYLLSASVLHAVNKVLDMPVVLLSAVIRQFQKVPGLGEFLQSARVVGAIDRMKDKIRIKSHVGARFSQELEWFLRILVVDPAPVLPWVGSIVVGGFVLKKLAISPAWPLWLAAGLLYAGMVIGEIMANRRAQKDQDFGQLKRAEGCA